MIAAATLCLALAVAPAAAHFRLIDPPTRHFDALDELVGPCGNAATPSPVRATFGVGNNVTIRFGHEHGNASVFLGLGENPTSFPLSVGFLDMTAKGNYSIPISLAGVPETSAKSPATLQIIVNGGDGVGVCWCITRCDVDLTNIYPPRRTQQNLFQCADVKLDLPVKASTSAPPSASVSPSALPSTSKSAGGYSPATTSKDGYPTKPTGASYPTDGPLLSGASGLASGLASVLAVVAPLALL
ncbi:hypothetical protein HK105_202068 [Polyrhizophydium stewartii]|uniref:Copper acquisition factor BIM1-like domain-containing protein n=1 Tax=Polyrhizophydium stewartii TaxID=2732419 RepID=A0ABR4NF40_9FUNG|nr:hypothetical protein HK105_002395 [Polyrhizophydium stewartii]